MILFSQQAFLFTCSGGISFLQGDLSCSLSLSLLPISIFLTCTTASYFRIQKSKNEMELFQTSQGLYSERCHESFLLLCHRLPSLKLNALLLLPVASVSKSCWARALVSEKLKLVPSQGLDSAKSPVVPVCQGANRLGLVGGMECLMTKRRGTEIATSSHGVPRAVE